MMLTLLLALGAAVACPILDATVQQEGAAWVRTDRTVGWMGSGRAMEELGRSAGRVADVAWAPDAAAVMGRSGQWTLLVRGQGPQTLSGPTGGGVGVAFADHGQGVIGIGADRIAGAASGSRDVGPTLGPGAVWVYLRATGETHSEPGDGSDVTAVSGDPEALRYAAGFASGLVRVWPDGTELQAGAPVQALDLSSTRLAVVAGGRLTIHGESMAPVTVGDARAVHLSGDHALVLLDEVVLVVDLPSGDTERIEVKARGVGWLGGEPAWVLTEGSLVTTESATSLAAPGPDPHAPAP